MDYKDYYKNLLINNFQGYLFKSPMICKESIKNNIFNHLRFAVFKRMIKDGYTLYHDKQNDKYFFKNNRKSNN